LTGQKKGGAINISEADKRLAKAIENRMAKGGEVDLEAADARLRRVTLVTSMAWRLSTPAPQSYSTQALVLTQRFDHGAVVTCLVLVT